MANAKGAQKGNRHRVGKKKLRPYGPVRQVSVYLSESLLESLHLLQENDYPEMSMSEMLEMLIRTNPKAWGFGIGPE